MTRLALFFYGIDQILLSQIFGTKKEEVTGDLSKLYNEEILNLYYSPNIIKVV
jgi:hypothetical protein